jgi:hypothetical protein
MSVPSRTLRGAGGGHLFDEAALQWLGVVNASAAHELRSVVGKPIEAASTPREANSIVIVIIESATAALNADLAAPNETSPNRLRSIAEHGERCGTGHGKLHRWFPNDGRVTSALDEGEISGGEGGAVAQVDKRGHRTEELIAVCSFSIEPPTRRQRRDR